MKPDEETLSDLFEGRRLYVVPSYQRLYVWNEDDQWEPLWLDAKEIADTLLADTLKRGTEEVEADSSENHFLGAVVLKVAGNTPNLARQWRVIDGQQRLTTFQLLLAASVAAFNQAGVADQANRLSELVQHTSNSTGTSTSREFKIQHYHQQRNDDYGGFSDVIAAAVKGASTDDIRGPMADCYGHFLKRIRAWLEQNAAQIELAAAALATTLILKLKVVGIYLDPHEKEHMIFETLNARGARLTEWDKIKNFMLYTAGEEPGVNQDEFFVQYLEQFDDPWWRREVGRGVQQRPRTDVFADYWLESRIQESVEVRRVFREFQSHQSNRKSSGQDLESLTKDLITDALYFRRFEEVDATDSSREALFHKRRLQMGVGAFWPLLFQLQRLSNDPEERGRWFELLESYLVRRMIAGYQARSYDQVGLELLKMVAEASSEGRDIEETLREYLADYKENGSLWPSDAELKHEVLNRHLPGYAQRLVLVGIESKLMSLRASHSTLAPKVEIEHLMPHGWGPDSWPLDSSLEPENARKRRNDAIGTLGNLTLLNKKLNIEVSNSAFAIKRMMIKESDNLFMNKRLLDYKDASDDPDAWTEDDITRRGEWMYEQIAEIWPKG